MKYIKLFEQMENDLVIPEEFKFFINAMGSNKMTPNEIIDEYNACFQGDSELSHYENGLFYGEEFENGTKPWYVFEQLDYFYQGDEIDYFYQGDEI